METVKNTPKIALVGRPNVGKSTLFNRLTRSMDALVAERPGLTRDRRYKELTIFDTDAVLIDTGGMATDLDDPLSKEVFRQTNLAIEEADVIVLIFDGKEGLVADDFELIKIIRASGKPFIPVVNKIDSPHELISSTEFYEAGFEELLDISAKSGRNLNVLKGKLAQIINELPKSSLHEVEREDKKQIIEPIRVSIIGRPNAGKSSLLNRLIGEPRMVVSDIPGTTRDAIDCLVKRPGARDVIFVDTAGIRRKSRVKDKVEKFSAIKALEAIRTSDICICVFSIEEGLTDQDKRLAGYTAQYGKGCITVFNKWDLVKDDPKYRRLLNEQAKMLKNLLPASIHFNISALTGKNCNKIFPAIDKIYQDYTFEITTGKLNRLLRQALLRRNPPVSKGHYLKIYYGTQTGTKPPTFTLFANYPDLFPEHYIRYLSNFFRRELGIENTPVKIKLRSR